MILSALTICVTISIITSSAYFGIIYKITQGWRTVNNVSLSSQIRIKEKSTLNFVKAALRVDAPVKGHPIVAFSSTAGEKGEAIFEGRRDTKMRREIP